MQDAKRTEIGELGEFGLIHRLASGIKTTNSSTLKGIGDDAAVVDLGNEEVLLISTDMLTEGVHFDLSYVPLKHLGYKSVAVNVSDIVAMNGKATQIVVSLGLSNRFSVEAIEELYAGMRLACEKYQVDLVGGDTTSSHSGLIINVSVIGRAKKNEVVYRSGAKLHDLLCVTGDLGGAYLGLQILEREKQEFLANPDMQPQLEEKSYIVERQLKPEPRVDVLEQFQKLEIHPTSMIDISDGLASEIMHISKSSGVGVAVYEDKLPVDKQTYETAREFDIDPLTCAMNGGEDYELLFTIPQNEYEKVRNHPDITVIGHITDASEGVNLITKGGNIRALQAQGWIHF